jgi:hypothetical protein
MNDEQNGAKRERVAGAIALLSIYLLIGTFLYPGWWHYFFFGGGIFNASFWEDGLSRVFRFLTPVVYFSIAVLTFVLLSGLSTPVGVRTFFAAGWSRFIRFRFINYAAVILATLAVGSIWLTHRRNSEVTFEQLERLGTGLIPKDTAPGASLLAEPTTFLYVDQNAVEALYGQYEPDLIVASAKSAIEDSTEIKAGTSIEEFLKTEIGRKTLAQEEMEYKAIEKKPERKLKELLPYLYSRKLIHQFDNQPVSSSEEARSLSSAVDLLKEYGIPIDPKKLAAARDRILAQQLSKLEEDLRQLQGLVVIQGDWAVQNVGDQYRFTRPFVDNISHSATASFEIPKAQFSQGNKASIDKLGGGTLRLRLFGNVLTGLSNGSRSVTVNPTALFQ